MAKILQETRILKIKNFQAKLDVVIKLKKELHGHYCFWLRKQGKNLLIGEEGKRHYVFIKDFSTFMYDHELHRREKYFCH